MKKKLLLFAFIYLGLISAYSQVLYDFNKNAFYKVFYDENFTPTIEIDIYNIANKTVTSIQIRAYYTDIYFNGSYIERVVQTNIFPKNRKTVSITVPNTSDDGNPLRGIEISNVRYSDGTICEKGHTVGTIRPK